MHIQEHLKGFILQNVLHSFDKHSILQIKENISIRCQTLTYPEGAWLLYISFQNYNIQEGTGKVIYKPSIFDEEQLHLKQNRSRSHKSVV